MPNLELIKRALCGKQLGARRLTTWTPSNRAKPCHCAIGEILVEAGVSDEEIYRRLHSEAYAGGYISIFPELQMVCGLSQQQVDRIYTVNDQYGLARYGPTYNYRNRADAVLGEVFSIFCPPTESAPSSDSTT